VNGGLQSTPAIRLRNRHGRVWVVHAHLLAGAEWRLHDPQRPLTHDRLLYVIQRPFGRITSMPATGQKRSFQQRTEISRNQTFEREQPKCALKD
jgi:hypothetical protein